MLDVTAEFGLPEDRAWLNAAHQGPLPLAGAAATEQMILWKTQPHHLQPSRAFTDLPDQLRRQCARLIGARDEEIALANSASYGLHLVANGLELGENDEVIVAANDFPSDILPWLRLERFGVRVNQLRPRAPVLTAEEVAAAITDRTRVVCLTWVHSFSGHMIDLEAIGDVCRRADVLFVVNGSQAVGAVPLDVASLPIDALTTVGFKWLCGPYGTGFCWLGERTLDRLHPTKLYWLQALSIEDLTKPELDLSSLTPPHMGQHDVFGTANFFNNAALVEAIALIERTGIPQIHRHNLDLTQQLVDGTDTTRYEVQDRGASNLRSSIVFLRPLRTSVDELARQLAASSMDVAQRTGMIRVSPHFYNTPDDIDRLVEALKISPGS